MKPTSSGTTARARPGPESYAHYAPAYRYGYTLATEPRYAGRDWPTIEAEARRDWEARHQGTWDELKDAVFYGWEHVRGPRHAEAGDVRIPIVEEAIHVETRQVERGGVRIYSHVTEQPVEQRGPPARRAGHGGAPSSRSAGDRARLGGLPGGHDRAHRDP